jgi:hypothetical protein
LEDLFLQTGGGPGHQPPATGVGQQDGDRVDREQLAHPPQQDLEELVEVEFPERAVRDRFQDAQPQPRATGTTHSPSPSHLPTSTARVIREIGYPER